MIITYKQFGFALALFVCTLAALSAYSSASISARVSTNNARELLTYSFFSATTTSATSTNLTDGGGYMVIAGAKNVALYFSRGGATGPNTGSSKFNVQVSREGTTWYDYNTLVQNLATSTYPAVVGNITISAATSTVIAYLREQGFYGLRCIVVETTDGEHTCIAQAEY